MSFKTLMKNKQNRLLSKTWRATLTAREIERNNYHATGDLRKARAFAHLALNYHPEEKHETKPMEQIVIFSA